MISRREIIGAIALLGGAAAVWPLAARAQQTGRTFRVGTLDSGAQVDRQHRWDAFRQRLRELGYVEGQNVEFETRWAEGGAERLPNMASELAALKLDVIVTATGVAAHAAAAATRTVPIVMATGADPVGTGLVQSLARPGANVTGVTTINAELTGLRLQLLKTMLPSMSNAAMLYDGQASSMTPSQVLKDLPQITQALGVSVRFVGLRDADAIAETVSKIAAERVDALVLWSSPLVLVELRRLAELALKNRLPTIGSAREMAKAGALISYGTRAAEQFRRAADFVDKILRGAKPADLPVEQPTAFELVVNLRTAKALGLAIPESLLARADEVIE